jgi:hypothetical protein
MRAMDGANVQVAVLAGAGIAAGLYFLWRGFGGYRTAMRISDIATSRISTLAAGEIRISGVVEPAETVLTSMLQSVPCVYYRSTVKARNDDSQRTIHDEERAVGFRVRDDSGDVRIFPRNATWDVPPRYDDRSTGSDGLPAGLRLRSGSPYQLANPDREALIADLLTPDQPLDAGSPLYGSGKNDRQYLEARIEPGDTVTIVGRAMPFGQLSDPSEADVGGVVLSAADTEVAMDIAEAREAGILVGDPALAWGNAAIPGFGIGAPVRPPVLDPAAMAPALAPPEEAARVSRTFDIAPEQLVVAAGADMPLLVAFGQPAAAAARHRDTFLVGLLGVILAIGSAIALAFAITSGSGA